MGKKKFGHTFRPFFYATKIIAILQRLISWCMLHLYYRLEVKKSSGGGGDLQVEHSNIVPTRSRNSSKKTQFFNRSAEAAAARTMPRSPSCSPFPTPWTLGRPTSKRWHPTNGGA